MSAYAAVQASAAALTRSVRSLAPTSERRFVPRVIDAPATCGEKRALASTLALGTEMALTTSYVPCSRTTKTLESKLYDRNGENLALREVAGPTTRHFT